MSGRYCAKHEEWAPTGECRWCEPAPCFGQSVGGGPLPGPIAVLPLTRPEPIAETLAEQMWRAQMISGQKAISGATLQQMMNDLWVKILRDEKP